VILLLICDFFRPKKLLQFSFGVRFSIGIASRPPGTNRRSVRGGYEACSPGVTAAVGGELVAPEALLMVVETINEAMQGQVGIFIASAFPNLRQ
jgi:hypothetical protein